MFDVSVGEQAVVENHSKGIHHLRLRGVFHLRKKNQIKRKYKKINSSRICERKNYFFFKLVKDFLLKLQKKKIT